MGINIFNLYSRLVESSFFKSTPLSHQFYCHTQALYDMAKEALI